MRRISLAFTVLLAAASLHAQPAAPTPGTMEAASTTVTPGMFDAGIAQHARLKFPAEAKSFGVFSSMGNGIFKPEGSGPFPTVLLVHSCGGTSQPALGERMKEILAAGYLVMVLDSFGQRQQTNCRNGVITSPVVWRDSLDALAHLQKIPEVDKEHIYLVGFSMGSLAAAALASPSVRAAFGSPYRFRALVGWYGSCGFPAPPGGRSSHFVRADMTEPLLLLMAENDRETPIRPFCYPLLDDLKAAGKPIEWHVFGGRTTHAWDVRSGYTMTTSWGDQVVNAYDGAATADAMKRTLEFLARNR